MCSRDWDYLNPWYSTPCGRFGPHLFWQTWRWNMVSETQDGTFWRDGVEDFFGMDRGFYFYTKTALWFLFNSCLMIGIKQSCGGGVYCKLYICTEHVVNFLKFKLVGVFFYGHMIELLYLSILHEARNRKLFENDQLCISGLYLQMSPYLSLKM